MAKKEELVDLKPEKVTPSQLEKIQKAVSNINRAQMEIGRLETQKHNLSHQVAGLQDELKLDTYAGATLNFNRKAERAKILQIKEWLDKEGL